MNEQIFADGIGQIVISGTTVRLDFVVASPTETNPNGEPKIVHARRVVMPVEAFLRSLPLVQDCIKQLASSGALGPEGRRFAESGMVVAPPDGNEGPAAAERPFP